VARTLDPPDSAHLSLRIIPADQHWPAVIYPGSIIRVMFLVRSSLPDTFRIRASVAECT